MDHIYRLLLDYNCLSPIDIYGEVSGLFVFMVGQ